MNVQNTSKLRKRREIYSCLCVNLNEIFESKSIFKIFISSMFSVPNYICIFRLILALMIIATIIALTMLNQQALSVNKSYFSNCSSNNDCDNLRGLQCSSKDGVCNCPAIKTKGHCDCSYGYFWNGTQCALLLQYNQTGCSANFMCDQTKNLVCINKLCTCYSPKIMDPLTLTCRYNYLGCYFINTTNIGYALNSISARMSYYVDLCAYTCQYKGSNFSTLMVTNNQGMLGRCYCWNNLTLSLSGTCDLFCAGKNGEAYGCGSSTSSQYHSVYKLL